MGKLTVSAAVVALAATFAAAPASAERNPGPIVQNGQCWHAQFAHGVGSGNTGTWGYWSACPQTASIAAPARHQRRQNSSVSR